MVSNKAKCDQFKNRIFVAERGYPGSLKREGVSLKDSSKSKEYQEKIKFWDALTQHGLDGKFQVKMEFKKARLILYSRVLQDWNISHDVITTYKKLNH